MVEGAFDLVLATVLVLGPVMEMVINEELSLELGQEKVKVLELVVDWSHGPPVVVVFVSLYCQGLWQDDPLLIELMYQYHMFGVHLGG